MRKIGVLFDGNGDFAGDCLEGMEVPEGYTLYEGDMPEGLFAPKLAEGVVVEGFSQAEIIAPLKESKINELWNACNADIESGFLSSATGAEYLYGFDSQDRENLSGTLTLMNSIPEMIEIYWKPKGQSPFLHTRQQFLQICQDAFAHKQSKIDQYWTKRTQVENAQTKEEIEAVIW